MNSGQMATIFSILDNCLATIEKSPRNIANLSILRDLLGLKLAIQKLAVVPKIIKKRDVAESILELIREKHPIAQEEIFEAFPAQSPRTLRRHLDTLGRRGVIKKNRQGRKMLYGPSGPTLST